MHVDGLTLMIAGSFISGVGCLLLFGAWWQLRSARAIFWWAAAYLINLVAIAVLATGFDTQSPALIAVGSALVPPMAACVWAAARIFRGRPVPWLAIGALMVLRIAAVVVPSPGGAQMSATIATMAITSLLFALAAVEFARGRSERLAVRWPMVGVLALHAFIFFGGLVDASLGHFTGTSVPPLNSWFGLIQFEQMIFLLGSAVFIVLLCRERHEAGFISAARVDALTGVANRGAFFVQAQRHYRRAEESGAAIAAIVFDLDHFKMINDAYGHAVGDNVLRAFAETAVAVLRPGDFFGRIGGEEFAAVLPGAGSEAAYVIAERVRHAFDAMPKVYASGSVQATVSAGVASAQPKASLEMMLEAADRALYRAKGAGRNRVERATDLSPASSNVIRVA
jgi:diguanylate cyclase (GGDEF)-like protein